MADEYKRDEQGQFAEGNKGGPGRPPRAIEADYLAVLSEVVSLERWRGICEKAADDAKNARDPNVRARARTWLAKHLCSGSLVDAAVAEALGNSPFDVAMDEARFRQHVREIREQAGLDY